MFVLREIETGAGCGVSICELEEALLKQTVKYWRRWLSTCTYTGRWHEMVQLLGLWKPGTTGAMRDRH